VIQPDRFSLSATRRRRNELQADGIIRYRLLRNSSCGTPQSLRIKVVAPDERITRAATLWKLKKRELSLADCFALATREATAQILLTTDPTIKAASGREVVHIAVQRIPRQGHNEP